MEFKAIMAESCTLSHYRQIPFICYCRIPMLPSLKPIEMLTDLRCAYQAVLKGSIGEVCMISAEGQTNDNNSFRGKSPGFKFTNKYKKETQFSITGDWLKEQKEVSDGYKLYYSEVQRQIGERGYAFISNKYLANKLAKSDRSIENYNRISREKGLITIIRTGRRALFILQKHDWMDAKEELELSELPANVAEMIRKYCGSSVLVNTENKEDIATLFKEKSHVEKLQCMRARLRLLV